MGVILPQIARFMGRHGAHLGPRWAPCWLHEPYYQGRCCPTRALTWDRDVRFCDIEVAIFRLPDSISSSKPRIHSFAHISIDLGFPCFKRFLRILNVPCLVLVIMIFQSGGYPQIINTRWICITKPEGEDSLILLLFETCMGTHM